MPIDEIYNAIRVNNQIFTGGQPTEAQLREVAAEGFATVINLAPSDSRNALPDEAGLVHELHMGYVHIPVAWEDPKPSDFESFERAMSQQTEGKTLIHCAANFRVSAFYSLYAQKHLGWSEQQAEDFRGKIWHGSDYPIWEAFIAKMRETFPK